MAEPKPDPQVWVQLDGRIVGPVPLSELLYACRTDKVTADIKFRMDGMPWTRLREWLPAAPQRDRLDHLGLLCVNIPCASSILLMHMPTHAAIDLLLLVTIVMSALANSRDNGLIGCIEPPFLLHLLLWPLAFPLHMFHRGQHGRVTYGPLPVIAVALVGLSWSVAHRLVAV